MYGRICLWKETVYENNEIGVIGDIGLVFVSFW